MLRLEGETVSEIDALEIPDPRSIRELLVRDMFPREGRLSRIPLINNSSYPSNLIEKEDFFKNKYLRFIEPNENKKYNFLSKFPSDNRINIREDYRIMDRFISSTILRNAEPTLPRLPIIPRIPSVAHIPQSPVVAETTAKRRFSAEGFHVGLYTFLPLQTKYTINGERISFNADNPQYAGIDFAPNGRLELDRTKMTESLAKGISGIVKYFQAIDRGDIQTADLLIGTTNLPMALICQRIGFSIVDQCKTEDGQVNKTLSRFTVIGKAEDIRHKVEEFQRAGIVKKICERERKLRVKTSAPRLFPSFA